MITHLSIKNFKGWKSTGNIRLAPITVLFGTNSSGKSSIGQFLMMLRQTVDSPDRGRVLHPGDALTAVDLGTFTDILHKRDLSQDLEFSLAWTDPKQVVVRDVITREEFAGKHLGYDATIGSAGKGEEQPTCKSFRYNLSSAPDQEPSLCAGMELIRSKKEKYELKCDGFELVRAKGRPWDLPAPIHCYGFPDEVTVYYQNADSLRGLPFSFQNLFKRLYYLGPLREHPKRSYSWSGETPDQVGFRGQNWAKAFLAAKNRKISPGKIGQRSSPSQPFDQVIARWLKQLGLIHSFKVEPLAKGQRDYRVLVQLNEHSEPVGIPDVGFGVSQILPILVECFYAPPHSTIIIEQPELHLHPAVQQGLADLFIEVIRSREDGADRNVQLIIESHSEHFLRRLQRRIAEEHISKDEVSAYFCSPSPEGLKLHHLEVNLYGNITNWPRDFFGDQMTDVAEMTKASHRRRAAAKSSTS